ncbi:TPA: GNAT family N-acetyltransferase, partial [Bacillus cereus]|nr:GNAT family N-acetyltransferase [Bacillus cereus]
LQVARDELNLESLLISFPNNSLLEGFVKKNGFEKNSLTQYEMYVLL